MTRRDLILTAALTSLVAATGPAAAQAPGAPATLSLEAGDVTYAYREFGSAGTADQVPLLLLQRFRGTLDDWDPAFIGALAEDRPVIVFSNAGVGSSSGSVSDSVEGMAGHAARFLEARGMTQVDVLGWSMGGFVAQALALDHPTLVRNVVLLGTGPGGSAESAPPAEPVFEYALRPSYGFDEALYLFFAPGREDLAQASIERVAAASEGEPVPGEDVVQTQAGAIQAFMGGETGHFARLGGMEQPSLIVSGDRDPFFPMKNVWLLYRELPQARLSVFPNAGHAPHHQHPAEVADLVSAFLETEPD